MYQIGNLALVCAERPDVTLQIKNDSVTVFIWQGQSRKRLTVGRQDEIGIEKLIYELNHGSLRGKSCDFNTEGDAAKFYTVEITETLQLSVSCEASSAEEAEAIVYSKYKNYEYILGAEHFTDVKITVTEMEGNPYGISK